VDRPDTGPDIGLVFPGQKGGPAKRKNPALSDMTLTQLLRGMRELEGAEHQALRKLLKDATGNPVVVHGFRSTFRDWAEDVARFPARVVEHALAHTIKDKAEAAYRRGDAFEQRKALMVMWEAYLASVS
jgi:integrase